MRHAEDQHQSVLLNLLNHVAELLKKNKLGEGDTLKSK
jgi:hypothetical protein